MTTGMMLGDRFAVSLEHILRAAGGGATEKADVRMGPRFTAQRRRAALGGGAGARPGLRDR